MAYCCKLMEHWSELRPEMPYPLIRRSAANGLAGIHINDGGQSFVTIAVCPWCGTPTNVELDKALIGKRVVEVT